MRAPEDVPIHHLVVDSGGFIKNAPLINLASKIYTLESVVDELKDKAARQRIKAYPFDIIHREPSAESVKIVIEVSKKTGDYASLSVTDLKVLALAHDLHVEHCGREGIVYDVQAKLPQWHDTSKKHKHVPEKTKAEKVGEEMEIDLAREDDQDDVKEVVEELCQNVSNLVVDDEGIQDENEEDVNDCISEEEEEQTKGKQRLGFGTWVDESNLPDVVNRMESSVDPNTLKMTVACLTTDFALQNVLLHMKMNISSVDGLRITRLKTYVLRCRICKKITSNVTKRFCPNCGYEELHKIGVSVDKSGNQRLHINKERERVTRGYRYSLPTPKGGKHGNDIRVTEDHMMPQNRMAKVFQDPVSDAPFSTIDVTSKSALLGFRSRGGIGRKMPRNPNELKGGKKRGGKRH